MICTQLIYIDIYSSDRPVLSLHKICNKHWLQFLYWFLLLLHCSLTLWCSFSFSYWVPINCQLFINIIFYNFPIHKCYKHFQKIFFFLCVCLYILGFCSHLWYSYCCFQNSQNLEATAFLSPKPLVWIFTSTSSIPCFPFHSHIIASFLDIIHNCHPTFLFYLRF